MTRTTRGFWLCIPLACLAFVRAPQADRDAALDHILDTVRARRVRLLPRPDRRSAARLTATSPRSTCLGRASTRGPKADQEAFWINAYNALVLQTVIDQYPINGRFADYPAESIRQIPGGIRPGPAPRRWPIADARGYRERRHRRLRRRAAAAGAGPRRDRQSAASAVKPIAAPAGGAVRRRRQGVRDPAVVPRIDRRAATLVEVTPLVSWREAYFVAHVCAVGRPLGQPQPDRARRRGDGLSSCVSQRTRLPRPQHVSA